MSSTTPDRIKQDGGRESPTSGTRPPVTGHTDRANPPKISAGNLSAEDVQTLRQEQLQSIRQAIESGAYDSEELLERAMQRMRKAIDTEEPPH